MVMMPFIYQGYFLRGIFLQIAQLPTNFTQTVEKGCSQLCK